MEVKAYNQIKPMLTKQRKRDILQTKDDLNDLFFERDVIIHFINNTFKHCFLIKVSSSGVYCIDNEIENPYFIPYTSILYLSSTKEILDEKIKELKEYDEQRFNAGIRS
jgi:hypothetical protein